MDRQFRGDEAAYAKEKRGVDMANEGRKVTQAALQLWNNISAEQRQALEAAGASPSKIATLAAQDPSAAKRALVEILQKQKDNSGKNFGTIFGRAILPYGGVDANSRQSMDAIAKYLGE